MKNLTAKLIGASVVTASLLSVSANAASALTLQGNKCSTSNLTGSAACEGTFVGNDANQDLNGLFGKTGWSELFKVDNSSGTTGGLTVTAASGEKTGTWSLSGAETSQYDYMAVIKGGNSFSAYFLNAFSGNWNTQGVVKGNGNPGPGLSHFTIYSIQKDNTAEVPEPLTILGSGLALGFGTMFKKKYSNKG